MKPTLRLWGTLAYASEAVVKREVKEFAERLGIDPKEVVVERMTYENKTPFALEKSTRGGVEGG